MRYIKEFDTIRAIAVAMVMIAHYLPQIKILWIFSGSGVNMFFVLSGYLITQILLNEKKKYKLGYTAGKSKLGYVLKTFYIRRILRIFPVFYLAFFLCLIFNIDSARPFWYYHTFYASNFYYFFHDGDRLVHFWSLAVEEQFYFFWPLLVLLLPERYINIRFFLAVIFLSIVVKISLIIAYTAAVPIYNAFMPSCIESFAFGVIALLLGEKNIAKKNVIKMCSLSLASFALIAVIKEIGKNSFCETIYALFGRTLFSIFSASVLLMIVNGYFKGIIKSILENKFLQFTGKISYGIYVYHMFIPSILLFIGKELSFSYPKHGFLVFLDFAVTFIIAWVSFLYFERPINNLKKRFSY